MGEALRRYINGVRPEVKEVGLREPPSYGGPSISDSIDGRHGPEVGRLVALGLSPGQARLFLFLFESTARNGYQPSGRDMLDHFGWTSPSACTGFVLGLRKKGWIGEGVKGQGHAHGRSYRLLKRPDGGPFLGFAAITKEESP